MPAEEATAVTLSATTTDTGSVIKEPTNADDTGKINAKPVEEINQTTENEVNNEEEEKRNEDKQQASTKNEEMDNKENVQENNLNVKENTTYAGKTKAVSDGKTEGIVVRKRRTPEKEENKDEEVSPPKKVK